MICTASIDLTWRWYHTQGWNLLHCSQIWPFVSEVKFGIDTPTSNPTIYCLCWYLWMQTYWFCAKNKGSFHKHDVAKVQVICWFICWFSGPLLLDELRSSIKCHRKSLCFRYKTAVSQEAVVHNLHEADSEVECSCQNHWLFNHTLPYY